jgi:hypothetical protein
MAIKMKEAKLVAAILVNELGRPDLLNALDRLKEAGIKNRSFKKTLKRITKAVVKPMKKTAIQKAA